MINQATLVYGEISKLTKQMNYYRNAAAAAAYRKKDYWSKQCENDTQVTHLLQVRQSHISQVRLCRVFVIIWRKSAWSWQFLQNAFMMCRRNEHNTAVARCMHFVRVKTKPSTHSPRHVPSGWTKLDTVCDSASTEMAASHLTYSHHLKSGEVTRAVPHCSHYGTSFPSQQCPLGPEWDDAL